MTWTYQRVFAREYNESTMTLGEDATKSGPCVITPSGATCTNLFCAGALLERHGRKGESMHARLADPTGAFELHIDRTNQATAEILESVEIPCFATLIGEARVGGSRGTWNCIIRVQEIRKVDRYVRNAWVLRTADLTLRRIEEIRATICRERNDARTGALIAHYHLDISRLESMAFMVKEAISGVVSGEPAALQERDPAAMILGIIREHGGKTGITLEAITREAARHGVSALEVGKAIESLLRDDECYQPTRGVLKLL